MWVWIGYEIRMITLEFKLCTNIMNYRDMPKEAAGGRPEGWARRDEVYPLPLVLHYPYRYSIVTTRTFPIGIRFTSRTKISYYTIIV